MLDIFFSVYGGLFCGELIVCGYIVFRDFGTVITGEIFIFFLLFYHICVIIFKIKIFENQN